MVVGLVVWVVVVVSRVNMGRRSFMVGVFDGWLRRGGLVLWEGVVVVGLDCGC